MRFLKQNLFYILFVIAMTCVDGRFISALAYTDNVKGYVGLTWTYEYVLEHDDGSPSDTLSLVLYEWYNVDITKKEEPYPGGTWLRQIIIQGAYNLKEPATEGTYSISVQNASGKFHNYNNITKTDEVICEVKTGGVGTQFNPLLIINSTRITNSPPDDYVGFNSSDLNFPECNGKATWVQNGLSFDIQSLQPNVVALTYDQLNNCLIAGSCSHQFSTIDTLIESTIIRTIATKVEMKLNVHDTIVPPPPGGVENIQNSILHLLLREPQSSP